MKTIFNTLKLFTILMILTGFVYPLIITFFGMVCFPWKAKGSIVEINNIPVGSELIGQEFLTPLFIHGRPSDCNYETIPSSGTNLGPASKQLNQLTFSRVDAWKLKYGANCEVPGEMVTASGSGLDPDISTQSALIQLEHVGKMRNWNKIQFGQAVSILNKLINHFPRGNFKNGTVNVLLLNKYIQEI